MNIYLFGSGKPLEYGFSFLKNKKNFKLILVCLNKKDLTKKILINKNVEILSFSNFKQNLRYFKNIRNKILISISFKKKIDEKILKVFKYKCFNLHPAQLPNYRGCFPTCWPILDKKKYAYYTLHLMKKKFDTGNILSTEKVKIRKSDNAVDLYKRLLKKIPILLAKNLRILLRDKIVSGNPQDPKKAQYFSGNIEFNMQKTNLTKLYNLDALVDVFYSKKFETFYFLYKKKKIKLLKVMILNPTNNSDMLLKLSNQLYRDQNYFYIKSSSQFYKIIDIIIDDKVLRDLNYKKLKFLI